MRPRMPEPTRLLAFAAALTLTLALAGGTEAAPARTPPAAADAAATAPALTASPRSFDSLGFARSIRLSGDHGSVTVPFSVRLDEVARSVKLGLRFTASPSLLPDLSHLKLWLNGQMIGTLPLPRESGGVLQAREVDIDPRLVSDYNELRIQLIGHYTLECEDPFHDSIWLELAPDSAIDLGVERVALADDLALLPAPFFDHRDNRPVEVPFVFATAPDLPLLRSAGVIASWLGALADYRETRFPLAIGTPPARHSIALVVNGQSLPGIDLDPVSAPTISVRRVAPEGVAKLLLIQGRDAADIEKAVQALVLGQPVLTGARASVTRLEALERRAAYEGPRWVRTDRPVRFAEIVGRAGALQARGFTPDPVRLKLRVPADLYAGFSSGVPISLRYRYSPPVETNNSSLDVAINDRYLQTFRLQPSGAMGDTGRFSLPLIDSQDWLGPAEVRIPAFQIGSDNDLALQFRFEPAKQGRCRSTAIDNMMGAIDPDSTIDLSSLPHYKRMPDLAAFAGSGFPFTRYADLGETTVVFPDGAVERGEIETYLALLSRLGRWTGVPAMFHEVARVAALDGDVDRDLLLIGRALAQTGPLDWDADLPALVAASRRVMRPADPVLDRAYDLRPEHEERAPADARLELQALGDLGAVVSFESPLESGRTVVAVTGSTPAALAATLTALTDAGLAQGIHGDAAFVRGRSVSSYEVGETYHVGDLRWWQVIWAHLAHYPLLLALLALVAALLVALFLYRALSRRAERRLRRPS